MKKIIINIVLILLTAFLSFNFLVFFPVWLRFFDVFLLVIILISLLSDLKLGLIWAVAGGFLSQYYSLSNFGTYLIGYILAIILTYYFFRKYITNRSIISLAILTGFSTLLFNIIYLVTSLTLFHLNLSNFDLAMDQALLWQIVAQTFVNTILAMIIGLILDFISNRLKANFLVK